MIVLSLDLDKSLPSMGPVTVRARDSGAPAKAVVLDHGDPFSMVGLSAEFHVISREGIASTSPAEISEDGTTASWLMPAISEPGRALAAYLWIYDEKREMSTQDICLDVVEGVADEPC